VGVKDRQYIKVYGDTTLYSSQPKTGVRHAVAAIPGGYSVEMAIAWTNLGITPTESMIIGFDVANNDDTGGGRTLHTVRNGTADNWFNTISFGDLTLAGAGPPPTATWTKVDDGDAAVTYSGTDWGSWSGNGGYLNSEHFSETTSAVATLSFTGTKVRFYGFKRDDLGYAEILVDNVLKATVDCYNAGRLVDQLLYETETLPMGPHTLKVRVKGTKIAASLGTEVIVDAFVYTSATGCTASVTILREQWDGLTGVAVHSLTGSPNYPNNPSSSGQLTLFEGPTNHADAYGSHIRGYVCTPETGNYTFCIASDDNSEFWLSTTDNPANKVLIALVNGWTGVRQWTQLASQHSAAIALTAGQRYYIEALQKDDGGDHVSVGWQLPLGTLERPIPGTRLSPWVNPARQAAELPAGAETSDERLRVFPVPARDRVTVAFRTEAAGEATVQVYDCLGRRKLLVNTQAVRGENKLELATGTLEDGLYLLQVTTGDGTMTKKLVTRR
jgi:hypothetical protein